MSYQFTTTIGDTRYQMTSLQGAPIQRPECVCIYCHASAIMKLEETIPYKKEILMGSFIRMCTQQIWLNNQIRAYKYS